MDETRVCSVDYGGCGLEKALVDFPTPPPEFQDDEQAFPGGRGIVCQTCVDAYTNRQEGRQERLMVARERAEAGRRVPHLQSPEEVRSSKRAEYAKAWRRKYQTLNRQYHLVNAFMARPYPTVDGRSPELQMVLIEGTLTKIRKLPTDIPVSNRLRPFYQARARNEEVDEYHTALLAEYDTRNADFRETVDLVRAYCREMKKTHERGDPIINYIEFHMRVKGAR